VLDLESALRTVGTVIGVWTLLSLLAALLIVPWFRARARANAALSQFARSEDWMAEAHPAEHGDIAVR
jgi:hypothetical protein